MRRPIIGISTNIMYDSSGSFPGSQRLTADRNYVNSVLAAGGVPVILPMTSDKESISQALSLCDGLMLTGGQDICPFCFGEEPHRALGKVIPERDEFDLELYRQARDAELPVLGICRGAQVIAVAEGGTLYQDLSLVKDSLRHSQGHTPHSPSHHIDVVPDTKLFNIIGEERIAVNSFHHQAVRDPGRDMIISARADDSVIEAIEHRYADFILAVQWHPERMYATDRQMLDIFKALIAHCG